jgi:hypothetical protein
MTGLQLKDWVEIAANAVTIVALAVGGAWTYLLFVRNRERFPCASLSQSVQCFRISPEVRVVHVAVRIENVGKVLLSVRKMECRLLQVLPLVGSLAKRIAEPATLVESGRQCIAWPLLGRHHWTPPDGHTELEPGESEILRCDFVLDDNSVEVVHVYSHLGNEAKSLVGWSCLNHLELTPEENSHAPSTGTT